LRDEHPLAGFDQIAEERGIVRRVLRFPVDQGADRNLQLDVGRVFPRTVRSLSMAAPSGVKLSIESVGDQRVHVRAGDGVDGTTFSSVTAVGAAARNELFAPETDRAGPAGTSLNEDVDFVDEH
jgi:hypothetical protein